MRTPLLTIGILTVGWRQEKFAALMDKLLPQAEGEGATEIIGFYNHGQFRVPVMRQRLLDVAQGRFTCFVDDDDMVSDDFVAAIHRAVLARPEADSVGFKVWLQARDQMSVCSRRLTEIMGFVSCGEPGCDTCHRGAHAGIWYEPWGIMTPTRTSLYRAWANFASYAGRVGEDGWARLSLLRHLGEEAYVDQVLYHYQWDPSDSSQTGWARRGRSRPPRPEISSKAFRWDDWSF